VIWVSLARGCRSISGHVLPPALPKIIRTAATSAARRITLTVQCAALLLSRTDRIDHANGYNQHFILLSIGILIAHALDAFRSVSEIYCVMRRRPKPLGCGASASGSFSALPVSTALGAKRTSGILEPARACCVNLPAGASSAGRSRSQNSRGLNHARNVRIVFSLDDRRLRFARLPNFRRVAAGQIVRSAGPWPVKRDQRA